MRRAWSFACVCVSLVRVFRMFGTFLVCAPSFVSVAYAHCIVPLVGTRLLSVPSPASALGRISGDQTEKFRLSRSITDSERSHTACSTAACDGSIYFHECLAQQALPGSLGCLATSVTRKTRTRRIQRSAQVRDWWLSLAPDERVYRAQLYRSPAQWLCVLSRAS